MQQAKAAVALAEAHERNRLLYVALTRARDRLYVAGFEGRNPPPADCWYNLIRQGLADRLAETTTADGRKIWQIRSAQAAPPERSTAKGGTSADAPTLPAWASRLAPPEPLVRIPLAPSRLAPLDTDAAGEPVERKPSRLAEPAILPPAALLADGRFQRGTLTHALLEHLPLQPRETWPAKAKVFVEQQAPQLAAAVRKSIVEEALAVLGDPTFAPLFGPKSRAEVPIAAEVPDPEGRGPALHIAGQIDRLAIEGDSVWIVDYKTNRPPPDRPGPGCGGLSAATRRLSSCSAAHLSGHAGQGCDPVDRRPENHGDSGRSAGGAPASTLAAGGGHSLTLGAPLPTFRATIPAAGRSQQGD